MPGILLLMIYFKGFFSSFANSICFAIVMIQLVYNMIFLFCNFVQDVISEHGSSFHLSKFSLLGS